MTSLPPEVAETTTRYLELIDKVLPDQVVGLYLTGRCRSATSTRRRVTLTVWSSSPSR